MRARFLKLIGSLTSNVMPGVNPKCDSPSCTHKSCIKDPETGDWYKVVKVPYAPEEDELVTALLASQLKELRLIKGMILAFAVLSALGVLIVLLAPAL